MPRDLSEGAYLPPTKPASDQPDMREPSFAGLRWLLRHPEVWSARHRWSFDYYLYRQNNREVDPRIRLGQCDTAGCAMGIAHLYWGREASSRWMEGFRMAARHQPRAWAAIFHDGAWGNQAAKITAEVVAGRIDDYLAGRPIRFIRERK